MRCTVAALCALALPAAWAQTTAATPPGAIQTALPATPASRAGPYVLVAAGRSDYDYDCFFFVCDQARGNARKLGFGYRFDVVGVEAWWMDHGKADTRNLGGPIRLRQAGVNAVWTARWGPYVEGLLRAGGAQVEFTHPVYAGNGANPVSVTQSRFEPTFGLGLGVVVAPAVSVQLAWDLVRARGDGTDMLMQTTTLGLKLSF